MCLRCTSLTFSLGRVNENRDMGTSSTFVAWTTLSDERLATATSLHTISHSLSCHLTHGTPCLQWRVRPTFSHTFDCHDLTCRAQLVACKAQDLFPRPCEHHVWTAAQPSTKALTFIATNMSISTLGLLEPPYKGTKFVSQPVVTWARLVVNWPWSPSAWVLDNLGTDVCQRTGRRLWKSESADNVYRMGCAVLSYNAPWTIKLSLGECRNNRDAAALCVMICCFLSSFKPQTTDETIALNLLRTQRKRRRFTNQFLAVHRSLRAFDEIPSSRYASPSAKPPERSGDGLAHNYWTQQLHTQCRQ